MDGEDDDDGYGDGDEDDEKVNEDYPEGEMVRHLVNQHSDENMVGMRIMGVVMRTLRRSIRMMRMVR